MSALNGRGLTSRETQVLALVAIGKSSREIAERLHLSVRTVERHRENASRKLGIKSMPEIVRWALHNGQILDEHEEWDTERFLATVREAPLMVLVTDTEMRFRDASEAALRELGYEHDELLLLAAPDIALERQDAQRRYASYLMTGVQNGSITLRRKDQSVFEASYAAMIRRTGDQQHYVSIVIPE